MSTTPDVRQTYPHEVLLTRPEYGERYGYGERTMQRYLAEGRLPGAVKNEKGAWLIPADAQVSEPSGSQDVVRQASTGVAPPTPGVRLAAPLGLLLPLEDVAAALGTSVGGVRRLADAGHLIVGRFGPRGALRVFLPPR